MNRKYRLTRSTDFQQVKRTGQQFGHRLVVMLVMPNEVGLPRVGIAAGRVMGSAVDRNRVKRRLRACIALRLPKMVKGWDAIFIGRPPLLKASYGQLQAAIDDVLQQSGLLQNSRKVKK